MCSIYCQKALILLIGLNSAFIADAQINRHNYNYLEFQKKPFYFGIALGVNTSSYKINHSRNFINNEEIRVAEGAIGPGFTLQVITNLKIGEYFDFRVLGGFSFTERNLEYLNVQTTETALPRSIRKIESIFVDMPFLVRYKSAPFKDKRAFVVAGLKYTYDVASNSKTRQADSLVKISPHDFAWEVGAGMQFFMPFFIFSPELKYSQGLGNILIYNDQLNEASVLEKLKSRVFTISFHFEG